MTLIAPMALGRSTRCAGMEVGEIGLVYGSSKRPEHLVICCHNETNKTGKTICRVVSSIRSSPLYFAIIDDRHWELAPVWIMPNETSIHVDHVSRQPAHSFNVQFERKGIVIDHEGQCWLFVKDAGWLNLYSMAITDSTPPPQRSVFAFEQWSVGLHSQNKWTEFWNSSSPD